MTSQQSSKANLLFSELVNLKKSPYEILIGTGLLENLGEILLDKKILQRGQKCAIVTDSNVGKIYLPKLTKSLRQSEIKFCEIVVPAGEKSKSIQTYESVLRQMVQANLDRQSTVLALGGGGGRRLGGLLLGIILSRHCLCAVADIGYGTGR